MAGGSDALEPHAVGRWYVLDLLLIRREPYLTEALEEGGKVDSEARLRADWHGSRGEVSSGSGEPLLIGLPSGDKHYVPHVEQALRQ